VLRITERSVRQARNGEPGGDRGHGHAAGHAAARAAAGREGAREIRGRRRCHRDRWVHQEGNPVFQSGLISAVCCTSARSTETSSVSDSPF
jgi:hypothetical protein